MLTRKNLWIRFACFVLLFGVGFFLNFTSVQERQENVSNNARRESLGSYLWRESYNSLFDLSPLRPPDISSNNVAIIYMDDWSQTLLKQSPDAPWDRSLHAQLLDRLTADGARAVVFDIIFESPGAKPESDDAFEKAIKRNGHVIIAADMASALQSSGNAPALEQTRIIYPYERFEKVAAAVGMAHLRPDPDFLVRQHHHAMDPSDFVSLSWAAARFLKLPSTQTPNALRSERWVRYYGGPETVPNVSFDRAVAVDGVPPGFFKDKVIFVGVRPPTGLLSERRDEFRSSTKWRQPRFIFMPAVEVHATMFLNLLRGDWLNRPSPGAELLILLASSLCLGCLLPALTPAMATLVTVIFCALVAFLSLLAAGLFNIWYPWMWVVVAQAPVGLVLSLVSSSLEWFIQRRKLEAEKKIAYEKIKEQAALLNKAHDAIFVHDWDGKILFWNTGAQTLYGWAEADLVGKNVSDLLNPNADTVTDALQACLATGEWSGELLQNTSNGSQITVSSRWTLLKDSSGQPVSILNISTDITEKKKVEAHLLRSQRMESLGALAGGIAHDLNNVFTPILVGVDLLQRSNNPVFQAKTLKTMGTAVRRGADLVKQVLTFSRGTTGERKPTQLKHLIREMDQVMAETFPKNIERTSNLPNELKPILADPTQVHQILLNLCVNARDAMPDGGTLKITAEPAFFTPSDLKRYPGVPSGEFILLKVSDSGTGIPPEVVDRIFEPFFTTKEIGKGTGLGLSTVMTIVKNHGGIIDLETVMGKGTTFLVYLPVATTSEAVAWTEEIVTVKGGKRTVLLVDDEAGIRELIGEMLACEDFNVITASNGTEAVQMFETHQAEITVVFLDMMLPGLSGEGLLRKLKSIAPHIPIIAMSGLINLASGEVGTMVAGFLNKPFNYQTLNQTLEKVLKPPPPILHA